MLVVGVERVNLTEPEESTIGAAAGLGAWLRARSTRLPWLVRAGFVCLPPRCVFCGGQGDLGAVDLCSVCFETLPFDAATGRGGGVGQTAVLAPSDAVKTPVVPRWYLTSPDPWTDSSP
jgi:hypothetical protein